MGIAWVHGSYWLAAMSTPNRREGPDAAQREAQAREYLRVASLVRERDGSDNAAGALLYESAKQCINAVANRQGQDPGPTSAKYYFLVSLAAGDALRASLTEDWNAVMDLHINADRLNLSEFQFEDSWQIAYSFIDQMLQIYAQGV